jgi:hypothetical protein
MTIPKLLNGQNPPDHSLAFSLPYSGTGLAARSKDRWSGAAPENAAAAEPRVGRLWGDFGSVFP